VKLLRFSLPGGAPQLGALTDGGIVAIEPARFGVSDVMDLIGAWSRVHVEVAAAVAADGARIALDLVQLHAPIARPGKIFAIGLNYADHIAESKMDTPQNQVWFTKAATSVTGPTDPVEIPSEPSFVDYEVELVAVIGKGGRDIAREDAPAAVFGFAVGNDFTERRWQHRTQQWSLGKSFDTHAPFGPWITTADDVADPHALDIKAWVGEELRQDSNTRHLVFDIWDQIAHLSHAMTLEPGDLIFTGTPGGIGAAMDPRKFLQPGEVVRSEIEGLGTITNVCRLR
jgi:2-keto-4-pentenoate hydratase/2-oxohepta-3-ene-1,7-dioic acid hydratase in catechol pathway